MKTPSNPFTKEGIKNIERRRKSRLPRRVERQAKAMLRKAFHGARARSRNRICFNCRQKIKKDDSVCSCCGIMFGRAPSGSKGVGGETGFDTSS